MKTWVLMVGISILILLSSAFAAFAENPFVGQWTCDGITASISDTTAVVTVDSENPDEISLQGIHEYSYDADVLWVDGLVSLYTVSPNGKEFALLCFLNGHPVCIVFQRAPAADGGGT